MPAAVHLFVSVFQGLSPCGIISMEVQPDYTIEQLKLLIQEQEGVPTALQHIILSTFSSTNSYTQRHSNPDSKTLSEYPDLIASGRVSLRIDPASTPSLVLAPFVQTMITPPAGERESFIYFLLDASEPMARGFSPPHVATPVSRYHLAASAVVGALRAVLALSDAGAQTRITVSYFGDDVYPVHNEPQAISTAVVEEVAAVLADVVPGGTTGTQGAVATALSTPGVSAVWLFSDAQPSGSTATLLSKVKKWNARINLPIHCTAICPPYADVGAERFMMSLASATGGHYRGLLGSPGNTLSDPVLLRSAEPSKPSGSKRSKRSINIDEPA